MFSEILEYEVGSQPSSNGSLKQFYRRMEKTFDSLEQATTTISAARSFILSFLDQLAPLLGISRIHLYECLSGSPELIELWGNSKNSEQIKLEVVPPELPWMGRSKDFSLAILPVGDDTTMLMVFFADRENCRVIEDEYQSFFDRAFSSIHYALVQNLRRLELQDEFYQAKAIQLSLLPTHHPTFVEFDIALRVCSCPIGRRRYVRLSIFCSWIACSSHHRCRRARPTCRSTSARRDYRLPDGRAI